MVKHGYLRLKKMEVDFHHSKHFLHFSATFDKESCNGEERLNVLSLSLLRRTHFVSGDRSGSVLLFREATSTNSTSSLTSYQDNLLRKNRCHESQFSQPHYLLNSHSNTKFVKRRRLIKI
jgi:hypothetical protein